MGRPCSDCPWRKDAPAGKWHADHFRSIWRQCQDDGLEQMACHKAVKLPAAERWRMPCWGWVLVMGFRAIGVRIMQLRGRLPGGVKKPKGCPPLLETFEAMMAANGVEPPPRNRAVGDRGV